MLKYPYSGTFLRVRNAVVRSKHRKRIHPNFREPHQYLEPFRWIASTSNWKISPQISLR